MISGATGTQSDTSRSVSPLSKGNKKPKKNVKKPKKDKKGGKPFGKM